MVSRIQRDYRHRLRGREAPFHGVFLQVAHVDNNPKSNEPMYRILRYVYNHATYDKAREFICARMKTHGNVIYVRYGQPFLIARTNEVQLNPEYVHGRIKAIEEEWEASLVRREEHHAKFMDLRKLNDTKGVLALAEESAARHNACGWVKYMKDKVGFAPEDILEPGVRCEAPADDDDVHEFEEEAVDMYTVPARVTVPDQKYAVVSVLVSEDDSMEAVVYVHGVLSEMNVQSVEGRASFEATMNDYAMLCTPMPVDVVDVGTWCMPVRDLWTNEPQEKSYSDKDLNSMQQQRIIDARKQDAKKKELLEQERQSEQAFQDLARVAELDIDLVKRICSTYEGGEEFTHAVKLASKASRDDAIALCIEKYGTERGAAAQT